MGFPSDNSVMLREREAELAERESKHPAAVVRDSGASGNSHNNVVRMP
jgi:hypothetical protein